MSELLLPPIPPYTKQRLPTERVTVPMVFPVLSTVRWRASYNEDWGSHRHTGCDLIAPKLTPVIAPFAGTLGFKPQTFWIVKDDGWGCLGTHLNDDTPGRGDNKANLDFMLAPNLVPGERVREGQLIGYVGDSGDAHGPHLHFELHGPDGLRDPALSLRAARRLRAPVLALAPPLEASLTTGLLRTDACLRGFDATTHRLTVQLVAQQQREGSMTVTVRPTRATLTLSESALQTLGGAAGIAALSRNRLISLYHRDKIVELAVLAPAVSTPSLESCQPLLRLSGSALSGDTALARCAAEELTQFSKLSSPRWIRTGSMALGPLRMRGTKLKQAAILGLVGAPASLFSQNIIREALQYSGFTRFGGAVGNGRLILILADG